MCRDQGSKIASIELRVNDVEGSVIDINADIVNINSDIVHMNNLIAQKADIDELNVVSLNVQEINGWQVTTDSTLFQHSQSIYAHQARIDNLEATMITTDYLRSHNIYTYGLFTGTLDAAATNLESCTVQGNLNIGTLNGRTIKTKRMYMESEGGDITFWIV